MSSHQLLSLDWPVPVGTGKGQVYPKAQQVGQWGQTLSQLRRNWTAQEELWTASSQESTVSLHVTSQHRKTKDEVQTECFSRFVPTRNSLRVSGCAAKGVLAMLLGLKVEGHFPGCTESLGSSDCKTHLTPSQGGDETPLGVWHWERTLMVPIFHLGWLHIWSQLWILSLSACAFAICLWACDSLVCAPG